MPTHVIHMLTRSAHELHIAQTARPSKPAMRRSYRVPYILCADTYGAVCKIMNKENAQHVHNNNSINDTQKSTDINKNSEQGKPLKTN
jgi:hypothetical protein